MSQVPHTTGHNSISAEKERGLRVFKFLEKPKKGVIALSSHFPQSNIHIVTMNLELEWMP
jgi:hypothetical protein